ncbi:MAG: hypothetical protein ABIN01_03440 [Ferruginibacter sp.]
MPNLKVNGRNNIYAGMMSGNGKYPDEVIVTVPGIKHQEVFLQHLLNR